MRMTRSRLAPHTNGIPPSHIAEACRSLAHALRRRCAGTRSRGSSRPGGRLPRRFESRKTGKSGYAQACSNEWVRGICEEPRIKCADCQHRRFLPVTDDVIRWHLSGEDDQREPFVAGVYPLLLDESCFFLALDFEWDAELCTASDDVRLHPVHERGEDPNLLEVAHASRWSIASANESFQSGSFVLATMPPKLRPR